MPLALPIIVRIPLERGCAYFSGFAYRRPPQSHGATTLPDRRLCSGLFCSSRFGPGGICQINPQTGLLHVNAPTPASIVVVISVFEYRQGQLLSEVRRDMRVLCQPVPPPPPTRRLAQPPRPYSARRYNSDSAPASLLLPGYHSGHGPTTRRAPSLVISLLPPPEAPPYKS